MVRSALAAALVLLTLPASASGDVVSPTWVVNPTAKVVSRPQAPKPWVGTREVHENRTLNTDVVEGTLALGGTFALVIRDDALPVPSPTNPAFTIAMSVFLTHDPTHDAHVGLFWKGRGNDDRTLGAWLAPGSTHVTFRVSTTTSTDVLGTANTPLPVREWCHIALSVDGRIMRFYVNGALDAAVETDGDVVSTDGHLHIGKDPANPGISGFVGAVQMHALALQDEDVQQMAAHALHAAPDFDGEPAREARAAASIAARVRAREAAHFRAVLDADSFDVEGDPDAQASATRWSDALDDNHLASFAKEQFEFGDAARASALKLADASGAGAARSRAAAERIMSTAVAPLAAAAAGGHTEARLVLAAMLEGGYGVSGSVPKPGRALYHRLMAAASGDPLARLATGAATTLGNVASRSGSDAADAARLSFRQPPRLPRARCALALHYFYHSATTAYEDSARPGGQARVERGRLHENTRRVKGDLRGESDDRVLYLSRAADLGDARAMLALGNGYYWGNFGLPRDHGVALRFYRRAHRAGALQGTVGVAKMVLKGEGAPRNASEALEHYRAAADRGSADALNGLGYLYFYGDEADADVIHPEERSRRTIPKNETLALEYFRAAAALGNGDGLVNAGTMLRSGLGAPADVAAAYGLFARCAELPGEHPACSYQAALIEAFGEGGVSRDCDRAVARLRRVAEGGRWMAPLQEGMKAHLAGRRNEAAWLYEYASAGSLPAASFNAAWLGERDARDARVARRFGIGDDEDGEDDEDDEGDEDDEDDAKPLSAIGRKRRFLDEPDAGRLARSATAREKRAATALRRHARRVRADSESDLAMRAWAALQLADCEYYGAAWLGGCAPGSKREALRLYREAAAAARAALALAAPQSVPEPRRARRRFGGRREEAAELDVSARSREAREAAVRAAEDAGGSLDARRLLTHALYAEAWMRVKGEACSADRARARRALGEALDVGGWRELVAVAPPFVGLALLDIVDAACAAVTTSFLGAPRRCAEPLMALLASSFGGGDEDATGRDRGVSFLARGEERRAPGADAAAAGDVSERRSPLPPGAFAVRLVSELIAVASAWEDAVARAAERWRFTLALSWSILAAIVGFTLGWRLVARPLIRALRVGARGAAVDVNGGLARVARGGVGGGVIGEMRRHIEGVRAEAAAEARRRRASESLEHGASRASARDDAPEEEAEEDFLSGFVRDRAASAVSAAASAATEPSEPERMLDAGDLDESSVGGHAIIRGRGDEARR